jgi:hypothetical protein
MTLRDRSLSASNTTKASGIYRATVTAVSTETISVKIPRLSGNIEYSDVSFYGDKPSVNDEIIVGFLEGNTGIPVALVLTGEASTLTGGGAAGDIEGVTAGLGLSGGGTSGTVALAFAPSELSSVTVATDDKVVIADTSDSDNPKHVTVSSIAALATASPAGSDHQVQFNNNGSFGADANFTYDGSAVGLGATLTVGVNDTGHDVKFFGATDGKYMEWDQSDDQLDVTGKLDVTGETTITHSTGNYTLIGSNANEQIKLTSDNNSGRPYISFNNQDASGNLDRKGYIGYPEAASDSSAIYIRSDQGVIDMGATQMTSLTLSGNADFNGALDVDGTTNLDVVDIDGAVDMASTLNVATSVGIGTTSPVGQLSVDSQNRQISIIDSGTVNFAEIRAHAVDNATGYANVNYNAYSHNFVIEGTRKLYIDNNGDILPDTDSTIDLGNSSRYFANAYIDVIELSNEIQAGDGSATDPSYTFNSDGNVGMYRVGTDSLGFTANGLKLEIKSAYTRWHATLPVVSSYSTLRSGTSGGVTKVVGYDGSSQRYKENITNFVKSDWENIYNLQAVRFTWKEEVAADKHASWGLISEDVYAQIPELGVMRVVEGVNDGNPVPDTVNYEQLCVFLIEAVKDLNTRLAAVE